MNNNLVKAYNLLIACAIFFLSNGCKKVELNEIKNLNGNKITLIGHGGSGFESPQNPLPQDSYSSLTKAVEAFGLEGVEVDIQMSADGALFMYHDNTLETKTDCFGCVFNKKSEALKKCRYRSSLRSNLFLNEKLNEIEIVLMEFAKRPTNPIVVFDIKLALTSCSSFDFDAYQQHFVDEIARLITLYDGLEWCFVESKNLGFLLALKEKLPTIKLSFISNLHTEEEIVDAANKGVYMISAPNNAVTKEFAQFIHNNGLWVALYGVKIRSGAVEAINKSPEIIYTDNIVLLQEMLREN